jgi:hypothetical protein
VLVELPGVPQRHVGFLVGRVSGDDGAATVQLGVEFGAEQDGDVGQPQPDEEDDDAAEGAVGLVVGAEVGGVGGEADGGGDPEHDGQHAAGADPAEAGLLGVG